MKRYLIIILLNSCVFDEGNISRKFFNKLPKPLTKRENLFISELKNKGFYNLKIESPYIGELSPGLSVYSITFESNYIAKSTEIDSLKKTLFTLAKTIYNNVLEDSIRDDIGDVSLSWKLNKLENPNKKIELIEIYSTKELVILDTTYSNNSL